MQPNGAESKGYIRAPQAAAIRPISDHEALHAA